jgi:hypothetical protein
MAYGFRLTRGLTLRLIGSEPADARAIAEHPRPKSGSGKRMESWRIQMSRSQFSRSTFRCVFRRIHKLRAVGF